MKLIKINFLVLLLNLINQISTKRFALNTHKKNRKLQETHNFITNIYFSEKDNYYYIKLYIGKNYMPQIYILDTTFSFISSPCNLCNTCENHFFPFYNIQNENIINCYSYHCSNTINPYFCEQEKCYFKIENYLNDNKNIEGFLINSKIFLNNTYQSNNNEPKSLLISIPLGCTTKEGNYYKNKEANGIIGLNNNINTFIDIIYNLNIIDNKLFSICLSKNGGYLSVGQINNAYNYDLINYIDLLRIPTNNNLYQLIINYIKIGEEYIYQQTISYIDSTSNVSYFPKNIYNFIFDIFIKDNKTDFSFNEQYGYCSINNNDYNLNEIFPVINIKFDGYSFKWKPENYFIKYYIENTNQIVSCIGIKESLELNDKIILGTNFMVDHDIIFDKTYQKIGFITTDCDQFKPLDNQINDEPKSNDNENEDEKEGKNNDNENKNNNNNTNYNNNLTADESLLNNSDTINYNSNIINNSDLYSYNQSSDFINTSIIDDFNKSIITIINNSDISINSIIDNNITNDTIIDDNNNDIVNNTSNYSLFNNDDINNQSNIINDINDNINETINDFNNTSIIDELNDTINILNNTILDIFNDTITDDINIITNETINDTINDIDYINDTINEIINDTINDTMNYTINEILNSTIIETNNINNDTIETYIENKSDILNDINIINISSTIIINQNIDTIVNITYKESQDSSLENISSANISENKEESKNENINSNDLITDKLTDESANNKINESPSKSHINIEVEKDNKNNEDSSFMTTMFRLFKSFLKNKLMYFFFALLGVILCFLVVILISCGIISCLKMFKRRNYMRQVDIEMPKDSNYNTASLSSKSS